LFSYDVDDFGLSISHFFLSFYFQLYFLLIRFTIFSLVFHTCSIKELNLFIFLSMLFYWNACYGIFPDVLFCLQLFCLQSTMSCFILQLCWYTFSFSWVCLLVTFMAWYLFIYLLCIWCLNFIHLDLVVFIILLQFILLDTCSALLRDFSSLDFSSLVLRLLVTSIKGIYVFLYSNYLFSDSCYWILICLFEYVWLSMQSIFIYANLVYEQHLSNSCMFTF